MTYKIYLVEDETDLNEVLTSYLKKEQWHIASFFTGKEALERITDKPHLWILDIMLPYMNGFEIIKKIKEYDSNTPVIFISARDTELDRVIGLEMGVDDYISKPFLPRELIIRVKNLLDRLYIGRQKDTEDQIVEIGTYKVNIKKRIVTEEDKEIELSAKEFDLLSLFIQNLNCAFSRNQILNRVWGEDYFGSDRVVDDLIRRLRKRMPKINLEAIYGYGYRMVD